MSRCAEWEHGRVRGVFAMIAADTRRYLNRSPESRAGGEGLKRLASAFMNPQVLALTIHRFSHYFECRGWRRPAVLLTRLNMVLHRVSITSRSCIGPGCLLPHPAGVAFSGAAGRDLALYALCVCTSDLASPDPAPEASPRLGDGVSIGAGAVVIGPVSVGDACKIAHTARVDRDVPSGMIVVSYGTRVRFR